MSGIPVLGMTLFFCTIVCTETILFEYYVHNLLQKSVTFTDKN